MELQPGTSHLEIAAGDTRRTASVLDVTDRDTFMRSVERAERDALAATEAAEDLALWLERLKPYFDRDPHLTVAEALKRYLAARPALSHGDDSKSA